MRVDYLQAWEMWWFGESLTDYYLWQWRILYWGRLGNILQFIGAMVILVEIIGKEKINEFGWRIFNRYKSMSMIRAYSEPEKLIREFEVEPKTGIAHKLFHSPDFNPETIVRYYRGILPLGILFYIGALAGGLWIVQDEFTKKSGSQDVIALIAWSILSFLILIGLLLVLMPFAAMGISALLRVKPIDTIAKFGSLILVLVGFHFSLLAS